MLPNNKFVIGIGSLFIGLTAPSLSYAALLTSEVQTILGNSTSPNSAIGTTHAYDSSLGGIASINDSMNFSAINSSGNATTISFDAQATAEASYTGLKAYAAINVSNPVTIGTNTPYVDSTGTHHFGVPTWFTVGSQAHANDIITIAADGVSYVQLKLGLSGSVSASEQKEIFPFVNIQGASVSLHQTERGADGPVLSQLYAEGLGLNNGFLSTDIWTNPISVLGGQAIYDIILNVWASIHPWYYDRSDDFRIHSLEAGGTYSVTADFSHTLNILEIHGFDINGNPINLGSATGSEGTVYNIAAVQDDPASTVPEPASLLLVSTGLGIMGIFSRRRRSS